MDAPSPHERVAATRRAASIPQGHGSHAIRRGTSMTNSQARSRVPARHGMGPTGAARHAGSPSTSPVLGRRTFIKGAAVTAGGVAALSAAAGGLSGCSGSEEAAGGAGSPTVVDSGAATPILADEGGYAYQETPPGLTAAGSWTIPLGCVLRPGEGSLVPCTITSETANPVVSAGAFSLQSGTVFTVVEGPRSKGANYVIYDVGCTDSVYAWIELDTVSFAWTLYGCALSGGALQGTPSTLYSADADWDIPTMACSGSTVVWQVEPAVGGSKTAETSTCYGWTVGQSSAQAKVTSNGRFGCAPSISDGVLVLAPRVREDEGVYYGITAYDLDDAPSNVRDQLTLPAGVVPMDAVWIGGRLVFQIEASYSSGGLLGQMGTYVSMGDGKFVSLSREPTAAPAGKGDLLICKSRSSYVVADIADATYGILTSQDHAVDYGEYPAREGQCDTFVSFCTVKDSSTGYPSAVSVRAFTVDA